MKTYKIDNVQRGLEENVRRPVVSNRTKEIDKLLKWKLSEARVLAGDVVAYTMVGLDVPPDKKTELQEEMEQIIWLTKRRVKSLRQISEKEFKKTLEYTEEIDKVPAVDEDWRDRKINETFEACGNRLRERLEWQMKKMDIKGTTGNHPFWHAEAAQTLDSMSMVNVDVSEETSRLAEKMEAYKAEKKKQAAEEEKRSKAELEEVAKDISESYKPIQKSPDDDIFAREKARGTARRGSERGRP
jgi:hypothetical protein